MKRPILICVAGGSASGKTTVVNEITNSFKDNQVSVIYMDNYYKKRDDLSMEERKKINYDHPLSFDLDLLYKDIKSLLSCEEIKSPVYDFCIHNRACNEYIIVKPTNVIILEGIMALYDNRIRDLSDINIYVESEADIRFIRRLKRDMVERGRSMDDIIYQYLSTVKPMYDEYVCPTKKFADIIIPNDTKHDVAIKVLIAKIKEELK